MARLDKKTELRVFCEKTTCRGQLATISESGKGRVRELVMLTGWDCSERGVWFETEWSKRQQRLGLRDGPSNRRGHRATSINLETGKKVPLPPIQAGGYLHDLPAIAICSRCGHRNVLDAKELRVLDDATRRTNLA
jgi:hypothetical protein